MKKLYSRSIRTYLISVLIPGWSLLASQPPSLTPAPSLTSFETLAELIAKTPPTESAIQLLGTRVTNAQEELSPQCGMEIGILLEEFKANTALAESEKKRLNQMKLNAAKMHIMRRKHSDTMNTISRETLGTGANAFVASTEIRSEEEFFMTPEEEKAIGTEKPHIYAQTEPEEQVFQPFVPLVPVEPTKPVEEQPETEETPKPFSTFAVAPPTPPQYLKHVSPHMKYAYPSISRPKVETVVPPQQAPQQLPETLEPPKIVTPRPETPRATPPQLPSGGSKTPFAEPEFPLSKQPSEEEEYKEHKAEEEELESPEIALEAEKERGEVKQHILEALKEFAGRMYESPDYEEALKSLKIKLPPLTLTTLHQHMYKAVENRSLAEILGAILPDIAQDIQEFTQALLTHPEIQELILQDPEIREILNRDFAYILVAFDALLQGVYHKQLEQSLLDRMRPRILGGESYADKQARAKKILDSLSNPIIALVTTFYNNFRPYIMPEFQAETFDAALLTQEDDLYKTIGEAEVYIYTLTSPIIINSLHKKEYQELIEELYDRIGAQAPPLPPAIEEIEEPKVVEEEEVAPSPEKQTPIEQAPPLPTTIKQTQQEKREEKEHKKAQKAQAAIEAEEMRVSQEIAFAEAQKKADDAIRQEIEQRLESFMEKTYESPEYRARLTALKGKVLGYKLPKLTLITLHEHVFKAVEDKELAHMLANIVPNIARDIEELSRFFAKPNVRDLSMQDDVIKKDLNENFAYVLVAFDALLRGAYKQLEQSTVGGLWAFLSGGESSAAKQARVKDILDHLSTEIISTIDLFHRDFLGYLDVAAFDKGTFDAELHADQKNLRNTSGYVYGQNNPSINSLHKKAYAELINELYIKVGAQAAPPPVVVKKEQKQKAKPVEKVLPSEADLSEEERENIKNWRTTLQKTVSRIEKDFGAQAYYKKQSPQDDMTIDMFHDIFQLLNCEREIGLYLTPTDGELLKKGFTILNVAPNLLKKIIANYRRAYNFGNQINAFIAIDPNKIPGTQKEVERLQQLRMQLDNEYGPGTQHSLYMARETFTQRLNALRLLEICNDIKSHAVLWEKSKKNTQTQKLATNLFLSLLNQIATIKQQESTLTDDEEQLYDNALKVIDSVLTQKKRADIEYDHQKAADIAALIHEINPEEDYALLSDPAEIKAKLNNFTKIFRPELTRNKENIESYLTDGPKIYKNLEKKLTDAITFLEKKLPPVPKIVVQPQPTPPTPSLPQPVATVPTPIAPIVIPAKLIAPTQKKARPEVTFVPLKANIEEIKEKEAMPPEEEIRGLTAQERAQEQLTELRKQLTNFIREEIEKPEAITQERLENLIPRLNVFLDNDNLQANEDSERINLAFNLLHQKRAETKKKEDAARKKEVENRLAKLVETITKVVEEALKADTSEALFEKMITEKQLNEWFAELTEATQGNPKSFEATIESLRNPLGDYCAHCIEHILLDAPIEGISLRTLHTTAFANPADISNWGAVPTAIMVTPAAKLLLITLASDLLIPIIKDLKESNNAAAPIELDKACAALCASFDAFMAALYDEVTIKAIMTEEQKIEPYVEMLNNALNLDIFGYIGAFLKTYGPYLTGETDALYRTDNDRDITEALEGLTKDTEERRAVYIYEVSPDTTVNFGSFKATVPDDGITKLHIKDYKGILTGWKKQVSAHSTLATLKKVDINALSPEDAAVKLAELEAIKKGISKDSKEEYDNLLKQLKSKKDALANARKKLDALFADFAKKVADATEILTKTSRITPIEFSEPYSSAKGIMDTQPDVAREYADKLDLLVASYKKYVTASLDTTIRVTALATLHTRMYDKSEQQEAFSTIILDDKMNKLIRGMLDQLQFNNLFGIDATVDRQQQENTILQKTLMRGYVYLLIAYDALEASLYDDYSTIEKIKQWVKDLFAGDSTALYENALNIINKGFSQLEKARLTYFSDLIEPFFNGESEIDNDRLRYEEGSLDVTTFGIKGITDVDGRYNYKREEVPARKYKNAKIILFEAITGRHIRHPGKLGTKGKGSDNYEYRALEWKTILQSIYSQELLEKKQQTVLAMIQKNILDLKIDEQTLETMHKNNTPYTLLKDLKNQQEYRRFLNALIQNLNDETLTTSF
jgi:hypothetical protein